MRVPNCLKPARNAVRRRFLAALLAPLLTLVVLLTGAGVAVAVPSKKPFEIVPGSFHVTPSTYQAGAHEILRPHSISLTL